MWKVNGRIWVLPLAALTVWLGGCTPRPAWPDATLEPSLRQEYLSRLDEVLPGAITLSVVGIVEAEGGCYVDLLAQCAATPPEYARLVEARSCQDVVGAIGLHLSTRAHPEEYLEITAGDSCIRLRPMRRSSSVFPLFPLVQVPRPPQYVLVEDASGIVLVQRLLFRCSPLAGVPLRGGFTPQIKDQLVEDGLLEPGILDQTQFGTGSDVLSAKRLE